MVSAPFPEGPLPSGLSVHPLTHYAPQAWRNGGGTTRALAQAADDAWRISIADIAADGPYSRFPDTDRLSLIISGAGVTLRDGGWATVLTPGNVASFDGDIAWEATLAEGASVALNAMVKRGRFAATITPLGPRHPDGITVASGVFALVLALHGRCRWSTGSATSDDAQGALAPGEVLIRDFRGPSLLLAPRPQPLAQVRALHTLHAALVTITPLPALAAN